MTEPVGVLDRVLALQEQHDETWREQPQCFWLAGLLQEVGELAMALEGRHRHTPDSELEQIAAICLNWLDMRSKDGSAGSQWDWTNKIPSRTWYDLSMDGWPGWEKREHGSPSYVILSIERGKDTDSQVIASAWDDVCVGQFWYRDITQSGMPFCPEGETYEAHFCFQFKREAGGFHETYGGKLFNK